MAAAVSNQAPSKKMCGCNLNITAQKMLKVSVRLNLGPVCLPLVNGSIESNGNGFGYNSRCTKRDLTDAINQRFVNTASVVRNILVFDKVWDFQMTMQGTPGTGDIGVHGGGHYAIGGDLARDLSCYLLNMRDT
jgi:tyrosinase